LFYKKVGVIWIKARVYFFWGGGGEHEFVTHFEDCDGMSSLVMGQRTGTHCEDCDGMTYQNMDPSDVEFSKIQNNRKISMSTCSPAHDQ
jgi:hypothetical protein